MGKRLAKLLKRHRKQQKISAADLALAVGWGDSGIRQVEAGYSESTPL